MTSPNLPGVGPPPSASGAGAVTRFGLPAGAVSVTTRDQDLGRGPGRPGGGNAPRSAVDLAGRGSVGGVPGGGYSEEDLATLLAGTPVEKLAVIQRKMQTAGLIGPQTRYTIGQPDNTTRAAMAELMGIANQRASSWENVLDGLQGDPSALTSERQKAAAEATQKRLQAALSFDTRLNTYEQSDPAGVRQTAEAAFRQALGRKPKANELERFVSTFLGRERASQATVFNAQDRLAAGQRDRTMAAIDAEEAAAGGGESGSEADVLWQRVQRMIADSPYEITPGKQSRSYEEQVRLYERYKAGKGPLAAKPGTSKHGDGRANDLKYSSPAARKWALENAPKYGLHFPLYNPKLARSRDESWHVEVLGGAGAGHSVGDGHNHAAMTAAGQAPISENVTVQRQDLGAQAVEYARNVNPTETAAYDIGQQFQNLLSILSKPVV